MSILKKALFLAAVVAVVGIAGTASAQTDLIPDPGFDVSDYVSEAITKIGAVLATVTGGFFTFLVIRKMFAWSKKM